MRILLPLVLILFAAPCFGEQSCYAKEWHGSEVEKYLDIILLTNRLEHCEKGDIIAVYVAAFKLNQREINRLNDLEGRARYATHDFALTFNEVSGYCMFDQPIIYIADVELGIYNVKWFNCKYLGVERSRKTTSPNLDKAYRELRN